MTSVVSTVAGGLETPDFLELRKNSTRSASEAAETSGPRSLYHVVPEKQTTTRGLMGSERGYDVSAVAGAPIPVLGDERGTKVGALVVFLCYSTDRTSDLQRKANGIDISIDAGELEGLSADELQRRYAEHSRGNAGVSGSREDMSDIMAKGMADMAKKKQKMDDRDRKKGKDFKF
jgi:splicing factor 3B subunit 2